MPKPTAGERLDKHDREIAAIRKILNQGMKMLVRLEERLDALTLNVEALANAQRETDRMLKQLITSLQRGASNGRTKGEVQ